MTGRGADCECDSSVGNTEFRRLLLPLSVPPSSPLCIPLSLLPLPTFSPHPSFTSPSHPLPLPLCIPPIPPPSLCLPSPVPPSLPLSPCLRRPTQTSMNNSDCVVLQDSPPAPVPPGPPAHSRPSASLLCPPFFSAKSGKAPCLRSLITLWD